MTAADANSAICALALFSSDPVANIGNYVELRRSASPRLRGGPSVSPGCYPPQSNSDAYRAPLDPVLHDIVLVGRSQLCGLPGQVSPGRGPLTCLATPMLIEQRR